MGWDESREKPVDRLTALGIVGRTVDDQVARSHNAQRTAHLCSLGVDLIAFKLGGRVTSKEDAEDQLSAVLAWPSLKLRLSGKNRDRIARWAVYEWVIDLCPTCSGAKVVPDHNLKHLEGVQPMKECGTCAGTGKRRYSDQERTEALGEPHGKAMDEAHRIIGWATALAVGQALKWCGK